VLRELTEPVELCLPDGRLNPASVGFTRRPLHRAGLRGWGRNKRWEYWGLVTRTHVVGLTLSDLDYAAVLQLYLLDRATLAERDVTRVVPFSRAVVLPDERPPVHATANARGLSLDFEDSAEGTSIEASAAEWR